MKSSILHLIAGCIVVSVPALADSVDAGIGCKSNLAVVAACFTIRGRVFMANGTPSLRVWPVGTTRLLGVVPAENEIVPSNIRGKVTFDRSAFATLEVCPLTQSHPNAMQFICIESATNVTFHPNK